MLGCAFSDISLHNNKCVQVVLKVDDGHREIVHNKTSVKLSLLDRLLMPFHTGKNVVMHHIKYSSAL